jgi:hypothetical protein
LPGGICTHWKAPPFHGARVSEACFFDAKTVIQEDDGQLRVWTKCLDQQKVVNVKLDKSAIEKAAQKRVSGYVPPIIIIGVIKDGLITDVLLEEEVANLDNIEPKARVLLELNCIEQKVRTLSSHVRTRNGQTGFSSKPSHWDYIAPETNVAHLQKILCR